MSAQTASVAVLRMIMRAEGYRNQPYSDASGIPTIGYGHAITPAEFALDLDKTPLTADEGGVIFLKDISIAEAAVQNLVTVPLKQGQFDALVDFVFNLGAGKFAGSTLLKELNAGHYSAVPAQLRRWVNASGKPLPGLVTRREQAIKLWNL